MIRNRWRPGRHLVVSDESGLVRYDDETVKLWDGRIVLKSEYEERHPQEFVKAGRDPKPLKDVRPRQAFDDPGCPVIRPYIGNTNIPTPLTGIGASIFAPAIGQAEVGCTLIVY